MEINRNYIGVIIRYQTIYPAGDKFDRESKQKKMKQDEKTDINIHHGM